MGASELRALRTLLTRAHRQGCTRTGESPEGLLFESLGVEPEGNDWPAAAVSALADSAAWRPEAWIRADPVHLEAGASDLRLGDPRGLDVTGGESAELCAAINQALEGVPGRLEPLAPARWYMRLGTTPRLSTREPSRAVGGATGEALPRGADAVVWLRTLTEIQMVLHDLPVNRARTERGRPVINSVWFWGAGPLPSRPETVPDLRLWSDSVLARGLARVLGVTCRHLPSSAGTVLQEGREGSLDLVYCDALHYAARLDDWPGWLEELKRWEARWFEPLRRALWSGELASLRIVSGGGHWHEVSASARWQWWLRAGALAAHVPKAGTPPAANSDPVPSRGRAGPGEIRDPHRDRKRRGRSGDP